MTTNDPEVARVGALLQSVQGDPILPDPDLAWGTMLDEIYHERDRAVMVCAILLRRHLANSGPPPAALMDRNQQTCTRFVDLLLTALANA